KRGRRHAGARGFCEEDPAAPSLVIGQVEDVTGQPGAIHPLTPDAISERRDATPSGLRRQLEGDLDKILLKALHKDPARRYRSVDQFSEDVRRHLAGLPVAAREDTYSYRAGKFVRRHPVGVSPAVISAVAQQVSFITMVWESRVKVPEAPAPA